jgi:hypothetical protein
MRVACESQPRLTIPVAAAIVAGRFKPLSEPGKMPGFAWDIPVFSCKRGRELRAIPGTVCSICYAHRGWMVAANVLRTQNARLAALSDPLWPDAMAYLIRQCDSIGYFRWFSAGDLQSVEHLGMIAYICRQTPHTRHWLPTHEFEFVGQYIESGAEVPENLCIRISSDYIESAPTTPTFGCNTSTVHRFKREPVPIPGLPRKATLECSSYRRRAGYGRRITHSCGNCRACWEKRAQNISYLSH